MKILFIQMGGTIDKDYPKVWKAYNFEITDPAVTRVLEQANPVFAYQVVSSCKKDSMDITKADRQALKQLCEAAKENHIVITHGTDTMSNTAEFLSKIKEKTIIITGSARPERFSNSDAGFNIGVAVGAIKWVLPGVYIAMNGVVAEWRTVQKDPKTGKFIEKKQ